MGSPIGCCSSLHNQKRRTALLVWGLTVGLSGRALADGPGIGAVTYTSTEVSGTNPIKVLYSTCKDYPNVGDSSPRNNSHVLMHRGYLFTVAAIDSGAKGGRFVGS